MLIRPADNRGFIDRVLFENIFKINKLSSSFKVLIKNSNNTAKCKTLIGALLDKFLKNQSINRFEKPWLNALSSIDCGLFSTGEI